MTEYYLQEIAKIVEGKLIAPGNSSTQKIEQVVTDSRTFFGGENCLFFALKGLRNDGHKYINELNHKGINAFVISSPGAISGTASFILVENTTQALQKLAAFNRKRYQYPVIGITGSNGKTIIKEWLNDLLSAKRKTVRSPKSYNSQIGVPLSVLLMDGNFDLGIFEAGISQPGEMKNLARIILPEIGILTNIGDAHQENFQSKKQKTAEKLQLFSKVKKLIFCVDNEEAATETKYFCRSHLVEEISWTLMDKKALIRFKKMIRPGKTTLSAFIDRKEYVFIIPFTDDSSIENACHCFAATNLILDDPTKILPSFANLTPVAMRLEIKKGINSCLLINDYYNSDLTSFSIALSVLHQQSKKGHLKKQVILSDIKQTGVSKEKLYLEVNKLLNQWQIDKIIGIGPNISSHYQLFTLNKSFYPSTEAFKNHFHRNHFSHSAILMKGARSFTFEEISALLQKKTHQTILEINLNALVHNLNVFRGLLNPQTRVMAMVKAFSYGSGDVEIAQLLQFQNVDYLAVAVADEGVDLRQAGIRTPIIIMNPEEHSFQNMIDFVLEPNIYNLSVFDQFERIVEENALKEFPVHLKIDTGMNRLGLKTDKEIDALISKIAKGSRLKIKSLFTHLASSDNPEHNHFTKQQTERFEQISEKMTRSIPFKIDRHILNSAGIERFPEKQFEMVRLGIGLYGISVSGLPLESISTFKSTVSQVKKVMPGETVGYGRKGMINKESEIAVLPVGYADGLDRKLGNGNGQAFIKGKRVPIVGNICMDMLMLNVTGLNVQSGDEVEFFGPHILLSEVAEKAGTIPYEILTGISQRVKRVYLQG